MFETLALSWAPSHVHGWGVFGAALAKELLRRDGPHPRVLAPIRLDLLDPEDRHLFEPLAKEQERLAEACAAIDGVVALEGACALHALGNQLQPSPASVRHRGRPNVGFAFFERVDFREDVLRASDWLDGLIAGSRWNAEHLRRLGFPRVACVLQGVDPVRFSPGPASGRFGDRFVVFSGGKLELRKGQDLVLAAFRRFHARHPEALLVTVWLNPWPAIMADVEASPHVAGSPAADLPPARAIEAWVRAQGLPEGAHLDLGWVPHPQLPAVLRDCHAAVFPNRCEGGTNLVAMEAMATGLPCVLSANSGHLDVLAPERCYALEDQTPTQCGPAGSDHWRDSAVDEIVDALERIHADPDEARRRGQAAHQFMQDLSWERQTSRLLAALEGFQ